MFTREFWLGDNGALVRAVRTFAQTFLAAVGLGTATNLFTANITSVLAVSGSAAILSLLMSLDRRESLLSPPPMTRTVDGDPASATYEPARFVGGCGGEMR